MRYEDALNVNHYVIHLFSGNGDLFSTIKYHGIFYMDGFIGSCHKIRGVHTRQCFVLLCVGHIDCNSFTDMIQPL